MEAWIIFGLLIWTALAFSGGVYFAFRHQARINKDVADYKQAAKDLKDLADRLKG